MTVSRALSLAALAVLIGEARGATPLTREDVVRSIDLHFPLIEAARRDQARARADLLSSEGGFDPFLSGIGEVTPQGEYQKSFADIRINQPTRLWGAQLTAGYRLGTGNIPIYDGGDLTNAGGEWRLGVDIPFLQGGPTDRRRTLIAVQRWGVELSDTAYAQQKIEARRVGLSRYVDWLAAGARLKIAKNLLVLAEDRDRFTSQRVRKGDAAQIEQTDNLRNVAQRRAIQVQSERALQKAALDLSLYYRNGDGTPSVPDEASLPGDGLEVLPDSPQSSSTGDLPRNASFPELVRLDQLLEQIQLEKSLAQNSLLPKLEGSIFAAQDMGQGSITRATPELRLGVRLEFPILFRGARGQVAAFEAQRMRTEAQRNLTRDRFDVSVRDALQAVDAARERARMAIEEVRLALAVEEAERIKLTVGDSNILFVNLRELATAEARQRLVDAQGDYHRARIDLDALLTPTTAALTPAP